MTINVRRDLKTALATPLVRHLPRVSRILGVTPAKAGSVAAASRFTAFSPLAERDSFQRLVEEVAQKIHAHQAVKSPYRIFRHPVDYSRDWAIQFGRGDQEVADALTELVSNYPTIRNNVDLWLATAAAFAQKDAQGIPLRDQNGGLIFNESAFGRLPWIIRFGLGDVRLFKLAVWQIAARFAIGSTVAKAVHNVRKLEERGVHVIMDFPGGEAVKTEAEADATMMRYLELFAYARSQGVREIDVSCKLTGLTADLLSVEGKLKALERMRRLLNAAIENGVFRLTIDMEQSWFVDASLDVFTSLLQEPVFRNRTGRKLRLEIVNQAYLLRSLNDARALTPLASEVKALTGEPVDTRLVKGAYIKQEKERAKNAWVSGQRYVYPLQPDKAAADLNFETVANYYLTHWDVHRVAFATHNVRQICYVIARAIQLGIDPATLEFQMLGGMPAVDFLEAVRRAYGCRISLYYLIGTTGERINYLARRLIENKDLNTCFTKAEKAAAGEIPFWELVQPPGSVVS